MPKPFQHGDDYDSDPEVQAEKEMAKKDPVGFAIDSNSLTAQKKAAVAKEAVSISPPNVVIAGAPGAISSATRNKSSDDKKPKAAGQTKALKKQRSRGISGCSSRKYAGYGDDMDDYDEDDYHQEELFDEDEEETYNQKK